MAGRYPSQSTAVVSRQCEQPDRVGNNHAAATSHYRARSAKLTSDDRQITSVEHVNHDILASSIYCRAEDGADINIRATITSKSTVSAPCTPITIRPHRWHACPCDRALPSQASYTCIA
jgi:hypothetical protein